MAKRLINSLRYQSLRSIWSGGNPLQDKYFRGQMVQVDGWLSSCLKDTEDSPTPNFIGQPERIVPEDIAWTIQSNTSSVQSGIFIDVTETGFLIQVDAFVPEITMDTELNLYIENIETGTIEVMSNLVASENSWSNVFMGLVLFNPGQYRVLVDNLNSSTSTVFSANWTFDKNSNNNNPSERFWNKNSGNTVFRTSYLDFTGVNWQTNLDALIPNSIIRVESTVSADDFIEYRTIGLGTPYGEGIVYDVTLVDFGGDIGNGTRTLNTFTSPISATTEYVENLGYWDIPANQPEWGTIQGELYFDGVSQVGSGNAYGVNISFQKVDVSPDWAVMSYSEQLDPTNNGSTQINRTASSTPSLTAQTHNDIPLGQTPVLLAFDELTEQNFISLQSGTEIVFSKRGTYTWFLDFNLTTPSNVQRRMWFYSELWDEDLGAWVVNSDTARMIDVGRRSAGLTAMSNTVNALVGSRFRVYALLENNNDVTISSQSFVSPAGTLSNPSMSVSIVALRFFTE